MKTTDKEKLLTALGELVLELTEYEVPQHDGHGEFTEETALGYARKVLKEVRP